MFIQTNFRSRLNYLWHIKGHRTILQNMDAGEQFKTIIYYHWYHWYLVSLVSPVSLVSTITGSHKTSNKLNLAEQGKGHSDWPRPWITWPTPLESWPLTDTTLKQWKYDNMIIHFTANPLSDWEVKSRKLRVNRLISIVMDTFPNLTYMILFSYENNSITALMWPALQLTSVIARVCKLSSDLCSRYFSVLLGISR